MSLSLCIIPLFLNALAAQVADPSSTITASNEGVNFEVRCAPDFATTSSVWIEYVISNHSGQDLAATKSALQTYGMKVQLIDPDGLLISPTIELPGHSPKSYSRGRVLVGSGERAFRGQLSISDYFEIRKAGRYRCVISKSCAFVKTETKDDILSMKDIRPLVLTSPEFNFEVKQIDPDYAGRILKAAELRDQINKLPPAGDVKSINRDLPKNVPIANDVQRISQDSKAHSTAPELSTQSEEPASSTPWSIIVVLIVAAIGLLWLLVKNRN